VQTEDSGRRRPHIITHLFADGGRVVKSAKTSYAEHVDDADMVATVRQLMKAQHQAMVASLRDGLLDSLLEPQPAAPAADDEQAAAAADSPFDLLERAAADANNDFLRERQDVDEPPPDSVKRPSGPPEMAGAVELDDDEDARTQVFVAPPEQRATQPDGALSKSKIVAGLGFGVQHISDRSFDRVVVEFLHARRPSRD